MNKEFIDVYLPKDVLELFNNLVVTHTILNNKIFTSASFISNKSIKYSYTFAKENIKFIFAINFYFDIISKDEYNFNKITIQYYSSYSNEQKKYETHKNIKKIKKSINKLINYI